MVVAFPLAAQCQLVGPVLCGDGVTVADDGTVFGCGQNGYVISHYSNGWAGLLHEKHIFRWKGNDLELVRYAVSENQRTSAVDGDVYVTIENCDLVHVRVIECRYGEYERTDDVIFEEIASVSEGFDELALLERESEALWQRLR